MKICGLQKTTLLDFPGHVAATIFLGGCNMRCPFCHNSELLVHDAREQYTQGEVLSFLKKRAAILEGVCLTGGEPALCPDLEPLIREIRELGYLVKLDTNGTRPDVVKRLTRDHLLDYVAMDIKAGPTHYEIASGIPNLQMETIRETASFLMGGDIPYEFRTTVVRELHTAEDFKEIGLWLKGCGSYFLQNYVDSDQVLRPGFTSCTKEELLEYADILIPFVGNVVLRGVDY